MAKEKLMTDHQGLDLAKMGRNKKIPAAKIEERKGDLALVLDAIRDGLAITIESSLVYPDWVREHLTPDLEVKAVRDPGKVGLWLHPLQSTGQDTPGSRIYQVLKDEGLLERSISYGHLKWYEENPDKIPVTFRDKYIYGWASVVLYSIDSLSVPCLDCDRFQPCVEWIWIGAEWYDDEPAGLRAT